MARKKKDIVFEVEDPLGRKVALIKRTYYGHILRRHPGAGLFLETLEKTVRNPDSIIKDKWGTYHYYKKVEPKVREFFHPSATYLWVCVNQREGKFLVSTCETVQKEKKGRLMWPKK